MKKASLILIALLGFLLVFSSCKKEPKPFPYPMEHLCKHWNVTHVYKDGKGWVTAREANRSLHIFTFQFNKVYYRPLFGKDEKGIYKLDGNTLWGYVDGIESIKIEFTSMTASRCEMIFTDLGQGYTERYRCEVWG